MSLKKKKKTVQTENSVILSGWQARLFEMYCNKERGSGEVIVPFCYFLHMM